MISTKFLVHQVTLPARLHLCGVAPIGCQSLCSFTTIDTWSPEQLTSRVAYCGQPQAALWDVLHAQSRSAMTRLEEPSAVHQLASNLSRRCMLSNLDIEPSMTFDVQQSPNRRHDVLLPGTKLPIKIALDG